MAVPMTAYEQWVHSVKRAIDQDQPLPIPDRSPAMTREQRSLWELHVKQRIHYDTPLTPYQWLLQQEQAKPPTTTQVWGDLLEHRLKQSDGAN